MGKAQAASLIFTLFFLVFFYLAEDTFCKLLYEDTGINGKSEFPLHKYVGKPSDSETP